MRKLRAYLTALLVLATAAVFWACSDDQPSTPDQQNGIDNSATNFVPVTLSGRTYTFTITGSRNVAEPFNSDFTIDFNTETSYTLHPSAQNKGPAPDRQGNYTYDPRGEIIHFAESSPDSGRIFDGVLTFASATTGTAHLTGRNGEFQDAIFIQSAP